MEVIKVVKTAHNRHKGNEGLTLSEDKTVYDDSWLHPEVDEEGDYKPSRDASHITKSLALIIDLTKAQLHRSRLIRRRTPVRGKDGKTYYRMQWVDPNADKVSPDQSKGAQEEYTYGHGLDGIRDLERQHSTRYPIRHISVKELKNTVFNYRVNREKLAEALQMYHDGEPLPPVHISPTGEILDNHHLVDMAQQLGLTHIPVIIKGNPEQKKQLESKLRDDVVLEEEDEKGETRRIDLTAKGKEKTEKEASVSTAIQEDVDHFLNYTKKAYPQNYIMQQAKAQGIVWKDTTNDGRPLPSNSNILWMYAHQAILDHIRSGKPFSVTTDKKMVQERMNADDKDSVHASYLQLFDKIAKGDRDLFMEYLKKEGITWKENRDPSINWKNAVTAVKTELAKGRMISGIRTRQKEAMAEANLIVTQQIKDQIKDLSTKWGKAKVMERASVLGIQFEVNDRHGNPLPSNSSILWMRASEAISKHIARGGVFQMTDEPEDKMGIQSKVGQHGDIKLTKMQNHALDWSKRNSQNLEPEARKWAIKALMVDRGVNEAQAGELYNQFMERARKAQVMIPFDPTEMLPSGVMLFEQLMSDGEFKNDYFLGRGRYDRERRESNEADLFGDDYNEAEDIDRPVYGVLDLYNKGLEAHLAAGEYCLVLKEDAKKRATGCALDSDHIPYGEEGKWSRSLEDPHHLILDRWMSKWSKPNKKDAQRIRAMDAVLNGTTDNDDNMPFESHIHGGVDLRRDIDHLLLPAELKNTEHAKALADLQAFSKLFGFGIKFA